MDESVTCVVVFVKWCHLVALLAQGASPPCFHILEGVIEEGETLFWLTRCGIEWNRRPSIEERLTWPQAWKFYHDSKEEVCAVCFALQIIDSYSGLPVE